MSTEEVGDTQHAEPVVSRDDDAHKKSKSKSKSVEVKKSRSGRGRRRTREDDDHEDAELEAELEDELDDLDDLEDYSGSDTGSASESLSGSDTGSEVDLCDESLYQVLSAVLETDKGKNVAEILSKIQKDVHLLATSVHQLIQLSIAAQQAQQGASDSDQD